MVEDSEISFSFIHRLSHLSALSLSRGGSREGGEGGGVEGSLHEGRTIVELFIRRDIVVVELFRPVGQGAKHTFSVSLSH